MLGPGCRQIFGLSDLECRPVFTAAAEYETGGNPRAVAVADLTGDGFLDVITANNNSANVSRLVSNGDGTFQAKSDHASIGFPSDIAAGDVTGDGVPDVVVMSTSNNGFMVMRGDGNDVGGLTPETATPAPNVRDIEIGDFNRDSIDDVVAATDLDTEGHSLVFIAQPDGTLAAPVDYGGPTGAAFVRIADFTGDGILDLLLAERTGTRPLVVLPGVGDGTFGARIDTPVTVPILTVVVGDLNNDGTADAVISSNDTTGTQLTVLLGNGDGTLTAGTPALQSMPLFAHQLVDLDGDGRLDLLGEINTVGVVLMLGAGDGTFGEAESVPTSADPLLVMAANLDEDEIPEVFALMNGVNRMALVDGICSYAAK